MSAAESVMQVCNLELKTGEKKIIIIIIIIDIISFALSVCMCVCEKEN